MIFSFFLAFAFMVSGIVISYFYDLSPTPVIVIIATIALFLSLFKRQ